MTAPTTRETADHAELARLAEAKRSWSLGIYKNRKQVYDAAKFNALDLPATVLALLSEIAALRGEVERSLPSISIDGEHAISDHRRWLARQLLDSRLDDGEAYSIVAYHPAITDLSTSLDAALALAERVLEPVQGLGLLHAVIDLVGGNGLPSHRIAPIFCAAVLKAKAQGEGG